MGQQCQGFVTLSVSQPFTVRRYSSLSVRYNFFKNLIDQAFENDTTLINASDKRTGQLDDSKSDTDNENQSRRSGSLTETQAKWQALQSQLPQLAGTTLSLNLFISGVPERDPSSDLYASKTTISSRDRLVGLTLPLEPTVKDIRVTFLDDAQCICETESPLTRANDKGDWRLLNNENTARQSSTLTPASNKALIRFRIPVTGYSRTVETKGTIQNVYWSKRNPDSDPEIRKTSTTYSIPQGWLYGDAELVKNARGQLTIINGVLKVEQTTGFLGASIKMVPCGKFEASVVLDDIDGAAAPAVK
jgi:hypothetical protein